MKVLAFYTGVFRGALISPPPHSPSHKRLLNREQHSFPKCTQSHCTFQSLEGWTWPQDNPIITRSAWNTGKALWPLINVRLGAEKVRFSQILEYSVHCINLSEGKKRRKKVNLGSRVYTIPSLWVVLACQHFISKLLIGHLPCECNNGKGMLSSVEQALVGRDEIRAPLKTPAWEAMKVWDWSGI